MKHYLRNIFAAVTAILAAPAAPALTLNVTPGTLQQSLGTDTGVTDLTLTGSIDAADLNYIATQLKSLQTLDLSEVTIAPYSGTQLLSGHTSEAGGIIPSHALFGLTASTVTLPSAITAIGESAFAASGLTTLTIPAGVTAIGDAAFADCSRLEDITVPATVTSLGNKVFSECTALTTADISATVGTLGQGFFFNCTSLTSVTLPSSLTTIGGEAFAGTTDLPTLIIPASVITIGAEAFYGSGLTSFNLRANNGVTLGQYAFAHCARLTKGQLPETISLGQGVFSDCPKLADITLPESVTAIPAYAFKGVTALSPDNILGKNITQIGDYALMGWDNTEEVTLPGALQSIGDNAMEGWSILAVVNADQLTAVPQTGENVWGNTPQDDAILYVKDQQMKEVFEAAPQWQDFNVSLRATGVDNIASDITEGSKLTFLFDGNSLIVKSAGAPVVNVSVYDIDGRRRLQRAGEAQTVVIDTAAWPTAAYIVTAQTADTRRSSVKIAK